MVAAQIAARGIRDKRVLDVFRAVPRHLFVPADMVNSAYHDCPLTIGYGQTISQPYIVALIVGSLGIQGGEKVLEIGTGSGYQAAILAQLGARVWSVERIAGLAKKARETLASLNYNVHVSTGDGTLGWSESAPYDFIVVSAAAPKISPSWLAELKTGGKIILPLAGAFQQELTIIEKSSDSQTQQIKICPCIFVPLIGKYGYEEP